MTQVRVFVADTHPELEEVVNRREHPCSNVRFMELVAEAETTYAVLVAWDEE